MIDLNTSVNSITVISQNWYNKVDSKLPMFLSIEKCHRDSHYSQTQKDIGRKGTDRKEIKYRWERKR